MSWKTRNNKQNSKKCREISSYEKLQWRHLVALVWKWLTHASLLAPLERSLLVHYRRVANQRGGLKQNDTLKVVQALLTSRITYRTPYLALKTPELDKLNVLIRKATKLAMRATSNGIEHQTLKNGYTQHLARAGRAQRTSQLERLKLTTMGRSVLERLGYSESYICEADREEKMPPYLRESFSIAQVPRNTHPEYHQERWIAQVDTIDLID